jgi:hypothetical protein
VSAAHCIAVHPHLRQSASNTLSMYSSEYQINERTAKRPAGEVCILASWVLIGQPHLVQKAQVDGEKQAGCDTHCTLSSFFIFLLQLCCV